MDLAANLKSEISIESGKTAIIPTGISLSIQKVLRYKSDQDQA